MSSGSSKTILKTPTKLITLKVYVLMYIVYALLLSIQKIAISKGILMLQQKM